MKNVVGFYGIDHYEIILYLTRILSNTAKKILIADYSDSNALMSCIPIPTGLDPVDDLITYHGNDYTKAMIDQDLIKSYDTVLINFGFNFKKNVSELCTMAVYSTNQEKHVIEKLALLQDLDVPKILIIKDMAKCKISQEYIQEHCKKNIKSGNIFTFDLDEIDQKSKLLVQYDTLYTFKRVSGGVKCFLKEMVKKLYPEIDDKYIKAAYKKAEVGH